MLTNRNVTASFTHPAGPDWSLPRAQTPKVRCRPRARVGATFEGELGPFLLRTDSDKDANSNEIDVQGLALGGCFPGIPRRRRLSRLA